MNDQQKLNETLSALLDGEAGKVDQLELRRLARLLDEHPELTETYQRYVLARTVLKGEPIASPDLLANVHAALEQEVMEDVVPTPVSMAGNHRSGDWLKNIGRVAIAASVAVIAVMVMQIKVIEPVQTNAGVVSMAPAVTEAAVTQNNRMINPDVMTVSAGDGQPSGQTSQAPSSGCVLSAVRADKTDLIWEKSLPAGYVLCKQNSQGKQCEPVSEKIACYLQ